VRGRPSFDGGETGSLAPPDASASTVPPEEVGPRQQEPVPRKPDPPGTRRNIIEIATEEFAEKGYNGARIDEIAARTNTSKRMLYYYFRDKEGLFIAVLEEAYRRIREIESTLDLDHLEPEAALRSLVGFTFDYQNANEDFIRLVMVENIHKGVHLAKSQAIQDLNVSVINAIRKIYQRGLASGVFRPGIDEIDLHMTISALCFFNVANRSTFSQIFKRDMQSPEALARRRMIVIDTVARYVRVDNSSKSSQAADRRLPD
jgi:AcrR family transcriptional regulator